MEDTSALAEEKTVLDPWHQSCREGSVSKIFEFLKPDPKLLTQKCPFGLTALHYAVQGNHRAAVDLIISHGMDIINITDNNGQTSLHFAAQSGAVDLILLLIDKGAKVNMKDYNGRTPLDVAITYKQKKAVDTFLRFNSLFCDHESFHSAVAWGDIEVIKALSCYVDDINLPDAKGHTAMHVASDSGKCAVIELLIGIGAKLNVATHEGRTPLHFACSKGNMEMIILLLSRGGNVNASDNVGLTSLHLACVKGYHDVVQYLISCGADVNALTYSGLSPLYYATLIDHEVIVSTLLEAGALHNLLSVEGIAPLNIALTSASLSTINVLLNSGALPNNSSNFYPLHMAAILGLNTAISKFLSIQGVLIDDKDSLGKSPLFLAAEKGHSKFLDVLLMNGAKVDLVCSELERTALHSAAENGHVLCVKKLLFVGANPNYQDESGLTPLHLSVMKGNAEVVEVLVKINGTVNVKGPLGNTAVHLAVKNNQFPILETLIKHGGDMSVTNDEGNGVLHLAAKHGSLDLVKWLIKNYNCDPSCLNYNNCSPLHLACEEGHTETAKFLSAKQSLLIDQRNSNDKTPLFLAAENGHSEILDILLESGAKIDTVCTELDRTALHSAAENGQRTCVEKLLVAGANPNHQDKSGLTPLHLSATKGKSEVVDVLAKDNNVVNAKGPSGDAAVHMAVFSNQFHILEILITLGGDINAVNDEGNGVLHVATKKGYLSIVRRLVNDYKVDPNVLNKSKWSPLHLACLDGHTDIVEFLSKISLLDRTFDNTKFTPLHLASRWGHTGCIKALLRSGADIYLETSQNETALHLAVLHNDSTKALEIIKCLVSKMVLRNCPSHWNSIYGKSVTLKDSDTTFLSKISQSGQTVICIAAEKGFLEVVKFLVEINKDVLKSNNGSRNALHVASAAGQDNVVEFLSQIIDVTLTCNNLSALDMALLGGHLECVELLLKRNATFSNNAQIDLFKVASIESTELALRNLNCHLRCLPHIYANDEVKYEFLHKRNNNNDNVLHSVARKNRLDCMRLLIEHGCNPEIPGCYNQTVLHVAAEKGYTEIVDYLLNECKVPVDVIDSQYKYTPLHYAVRYKHVKCMELLLQRNPVLSLLDCNGKNILHLAVDHLVSCHNHIYIKTIVSRVVEMQNRDSDFVDDFSAALIMKSVTPLHQIVSYGSVQILKLLSPFIKDVVVKDQEYGDTPLHRAVRLQHLEMVKLLVEKQRKSLYETNNNEQTPTDLAPINIRTYLQKELDKYKHLKV